MVNYYEQLNLHKESSIVAINKELSALESTWKRREITNPEKATKMLVLIMDARKIFQSESTKAQYDIELEKARKNLYLLMEKPKGRSN